MATEGTPKGKRVKTLVRISVKCPNGTVTLIRDAIGGPLDDEEQAALADMHLAMRRFVVAGNDAPVRLGEPPKPVSEPHP